MGSQTGAADEADGESTPLLSITKTPSSSKQQGREGIISKRFNNKQSSSLSYSDDEPQDMTLSRRMARYLVGAWPGYCPPEKRQMLDKAWEYWEYFTLSRRIYHGPASSQEEKKKKGGYVKAAPGERDFDTRLYPLSTPISDLSDLGIGVGVYFYTLRQLGLIMLVAGLISLPTMLYYASAEYSPNDEFDYAQVVVKLFHAENWFLQSSAICTSQQWVACPTCTRQQFGQDFPATYERFASTATTTTGQIRTFIQLNNCEISRQAGFFALCSMLFATVALAVLGWVIHYKQVAAFDEQQQTVSDYAIQVLNPPADARSETEIQDFFSRFGHVTSVTIALDNEPLLRQLYCRQGYLTQLEQVLEICDDAEQCQRLDSPKGRQEALSKMPRLSWFSKACVRIGLVDDAKALDQKITAIEKEICRDTDGDDRMANKKQRTQYSISRVFVVFEKQEAQLRCLRAMNFSARDIARQDVSRIDKKNLLFRNKVVLSIEEAPEPEAIRWMELNTPFKTQIKQQIGTLLVMVVTILTGCVIVFYCRANGAFYGALAVTAVNTVAPYICFYTVYYCESHATEGSFQRSLYFKTTAFLWIITSLLTAKTTAFTETLDGTSISLIPAMSAVFLTETLKTPLTQIVDPVGRFSRFFLAPRAKTQKEMFNYFRGVKYYLSERYTNLTNMLFLTFFYATLFPGGFFLAAIALLVHYWTDKYCILRLWAPAPPVGTEIGYITRTFFFTASVMVYALVAAYNFASFPYDNACESEENVRDDYVGTFQVTNGIGEPISITISSNEKAYYCCNQDMAQYTFPPVPKNQPVGNEWMSPEQEEIAVLFGRTAVAIIAACIVFWIIHLLAWVRSKNSYPETPDSTEGFSTPPVKSAYVPQVELPGEPFPILFCDISKIDPQLLAWQDYSDDQPDYKRHSTVYACGLENRGVFSTVHHWPPPPK